MGWQKKGVADFVRLWPARIRPGGEGPGSGAAEGGRSTQGINRFLEGFSGGNHLPAGIQLARAFHPRGGHQSTLTTKESQKSFLIQVSAADPKIIAADRIPHDGQAHLEKIAPHIGDLGEFLDGIRAVHQAASGHSRLCDGAAPMLVANGFTPQWVPPARYIARGDDIGQRGRPPSVAENAIPGLQTAALEPGAFRPRPDSHEQAIRFENRAVYEFDPRHRLRAQKAFPGDSAVDLHAFFAETFGHDGTDSISRRSQEGGGKSLDHIDFEPELSSGRGDFHADEAGPDDDQARGLPEPLAQGPSVGEISQRMDSL